MASKTHGSVTDSLGYEAPKKTYASVTDALFGKESSLAPGQAEEQDRRLKEFDAALALGEDAFEVDLDQASIMLAEENRELRGKIIGCGVLFAIIFLGSLCISPSLGVGFINPALVLDALAAHVQSFFGSIIGQPMDLTMEQMIQQHPAYYMVELRFGTSLAAALCGVLLAVAGSLYQMVFKNPIAAPTMLGVSNGISLGILLFVLIFRENALVMEGQRYLFSYGGAVIVLLLVLGLTKAICGRGKAFSVFELLLVGSIFSQLCGGVVQAITDTAMTDQLFEVYTQINEVTGVQMGVAGIVVLAIIAVVTLVPVFLARYAINTISYSDLEARLIGLDTEKLKVACLCFGTVMVTVAQVAVGTVSMIALIVPFISRALFGTEFKHQLWGDILIGAVLLLLCRDLVVLFPFSHMELTLGSVVGFVTLPIYVWIIASKQRGWK
ncbi:MAG: iron ABC transporter permease [Coriobacteriia bacterium]|nr:iron ABC transporter permease [Coriobacteriia bacterium]